MRVPRAVARLAHEVILVFAGDPNVPAWPDVEPLPPSIALGALAVALGALSGAAAQSRGVPLGEVLDSLLAQVRDVAASEFVRPVWVLH